MRNNIMKKAQISYQTDFMPYSRAIRVYRNILNDVYKNEPGYEKIYFKSRKTVDINNELIDYFINHKKINDTISNYINNDLGDPENPFSLTFVSYKYSPINIYLSISLNYAVNNKSYVHAYMSGPIGNIVIINKKAYNVISINCEIIQLIPTIIDNIADKLLESYIILPNPSLINDDNNIPDLFKKYNMKCVGLSIMK